MASIKKIPICFNLEIRWKLNTVSCSQNTLNASKTFFAVAGLSQLLQQFLKHKKRHQFVVFFTCILVWIIQLNPVLNPVVVCLTKISINFSKLHQLQINKFLSYFYRRTKENEAPLCSPNKFKSQTGRNCGLKLILYLAIFPQFFEFYVCKITLLIMHAMQYVVGLVFCVVHLK